jgi:hypothetical protein
LARKFSLDHAVIFASAAAAIKASGYGGTKRGWDALPTLGDVSLLLRSYPGGRYSSGLLDRIASVTLV